MDKLSKQVHVEQLAAAAGLELPAAYVQELDEAYAHVKRMLDRIPRDWTYGDEPAHVFLASKFGQGQE